MPKLCALIACENRDLKGAKSSGLTRHSFPSNDVIREQWEVFVNKYNRSQGWNSNGGKKKAFLCQAHFEKEDYLPSGRLTKAAVPTKAPKFTAERALKFNLIPSLHSRLLEQLNDFEKDFKQAIVEEDFPQALPPELHALDDVIDMPMMPLNRMNSSVHADIRDAGIQVLKEESSGQDKENNPSASHLMECDDAMDEDQPLIRETSSFESMKLNTSGLRLSSTPMKRKQHIGDLRVSDFDSKAKAEKSLGLVMSKVGDLRHRCRMLRQEVNRKNKRIKDLETMLYHLKKKSLVIPEAATLIKVTGEECV